MKANYRKTAEDLGLDLTSRTVVVGADVPDGWRQVNTFRHRDRFYKMAASGQIGHIRVVTPGCKKGTMFIRKDDGERCLEYWEELEQLEEQPEPATEIDVIRKNQANAASALAGLICDMSAVKEKVDYIYRYIKQDPVPAS